MRCQQRDANSMVTLLLCVTLSRGWSLQNILMSRLVKLLPVSRFRSLYSIYVKSSGFYVTRHVRWHDDHVIFFCFYLALKLQHIPISDAPTSLTHHNRFDFAMPYTCTKSSEVHLCRLRLFFIPEEDREWFRQSIIIDIQGWLKIGLLGYDAAGGSEDVSQIASKDDDSDNGD